MSHKLALLTGLLSLSIIGCGERTVVAPTLGAPDASHDESGIPETIDPRNREALGPDGLSPSRSSSMSATTGASFTTATIDAPAIINNGVVQLGVNQAGALNVGGGTRSSGTGTTVVGLRYMPTNAASTEPGCTCEGWGVADNVSREWGGQNTAVDGTRNLTVESFVKTPSTAVSSVRVGSRMRVTHDYHPSTKTPNLYEVTVTIENISSANIEALYRRVMDWDIEPTAFRELVTIRKGSSPLLYRTDNNGFNSVNPFSFSSFGQLNRDITDFGPTDHGALFDFNFGVLKPGEKITFFTYYGAAGNETDALLALANIGAEAYSLGQPSTAAGRATGAPNTFMFAFAGIGGVTIPELPPVAPIVNATITGTLGSDGWYTSDVGITFAIAAEGNTTQVGCDPVTLSTNTASSTYTCTAMDARGLTGTKSVTVKRDDTVPVVTGTPSGTLGSNNWYTSDVQIAWSTSAAGPSGITASCPVESLTSDTEGASYSCSATTGAGLSATGTITVKRDASAPELTGTANGAMGNNGWYTSDVTVSWAASDPTSGVDAEPCVAAVLNSDNASASFSCTATNGAGLTTTTSVTVMRDATKPVIGYAGNAGSYTVDMRIAITCSASDAMSGLAANSCANVTGEAYNFPIGANSFSASAVDNAGNVASASATFNVVVTAGAVCRLVERWSDQLGIAHSMCTKLEKGNYEPFKHELSAQTGKAISEANAAILLRLVNTL